MSIIHDALKKVEAAGYVSRRTSGGLFAQAQGREDGIGPTLTLLIGLFLIASLAWAFLPKTGQSGSIAQPSAIQDTGKDTLASEAAPQGGHLKSGIGLYRSGRLDDALTELKSALEETPDNPVVYNNIGAVYAAKGDYSAAEQFFIRASDDKSYAEAFNNRGAVVIKLGRPGEAIGHFKTALAINPGYADAHLNMAAACEKTGDAEGALAHYKAYLELGSDAETKATAAGKIPALTGAILSGQRRGEGPVP